MHATEHEQTIGDIVRIFSALDTADAAEAGGFGSERDAASADLEMVSKPPAQTVEAYEGAG